MTVSHKISVTIITGFLGAGKTTFINTLLKTYSETQFALVENEFGDVSIDSQLIKGVNASQMFELKQGCICCTISDEYELILTELAERFPNVEHLLIETTGIADPAPVIRPFFRYENLKEIYAFKGSVCLVDTVNFETGIETELKYKQIATADVILISKSENLSVSEKENLKMQISQISPLSEIHFGNYGISRQFNFEDISFLPKYFPDYSGEKINHSEISTQTLTFSNPLNKEKFTHWLFYNLDVYKNKIYRVKGVLCFEKEPYEYILQGVGGSFELTESENLSEDYKSQMVFIGNLAEIVLEPSF